MRIQAMAAKNPGDELEPWTYEQPILGPFDCLLRVLACGLCSSDLHMIDNHWGMSRYPLVPGHEVIGEVVEIGSRVTKLSVGDRVGVGWQRSACFECHDCLKGSEHCCNHGYQALLADGYGGFADHMTADSRFCFRIPDGLPTEQAGPLLCGGITVYSALCGAGMTASQASQEIGVIGLGGLGHLAIQFAAKSGHRVTVFTSSEDKAAAASRLGAHRTILTQPDGRPAAGPDRPLDLLISTVPSQLPWGAYVELIRHGGALTFVGVPPGPSTLPLDALIPTRRRLLTSSIAGRPMIRETLEVASRIGVQPVIETFPLAEVNHAIRRLRDGRIRYRAVLMLDQSR
ncbi:MAG: Alcohol dehydrogenase [Nitrospira sp.]|jgi:uncharacterized zinc-type alcohol dehydrogenase-like protein|nr:MAG: Alcohol dehydrogenase [Nitrospira sp.]